MNLGNFDYSLLPLTVLDGVGIVRGGIIGICLLLLIEFEVEDEAVLETFIALVCETHRRK